MNVYVNSKQVFFIAEQELKTITDAICSKSRSVIHLGKKFFYEQIDEDLHTAYRQVFKYILIKYLCHIRELSLASGSIYSVAKCPKRNK